jgi:hypothetical protein
LNFKYKFINLSLKDKILLYLLPILLLLFTYLNIDNSLPEKDIKNTKIKVQIKKEQTKIKNLKTKQKKFTKLDILKSYEKLAKSLEIDISNIEFTKNYIELDFQGEYKNTINFFYTIDRINNIVSFSLEYKDGKLFIKSLLKSKIFNDINSLSIAYENDIANPFVKLSISKDNIYSKSKAIIGDWVMLDNDWYTIGDKYKKYIIKKIYKDYILLGFGTKTIKMEIFNESK